MENGFLGSRHRNNCIYSCHLLFYDVVFLGRETDGESEGGGGVVGYIRRMCYQAKASCCSPRRIFQHLVFK